MDLCRGLRRAAGVGQISKRGGRAIALQANVAQLFAAATKAFGKINILVNNAGVYAFGSLEEITEERFHRHFDINVLGLLLVTQEAVKHFDPAGGSIINISSAVTSLTPPNTSVYTATKGAVDAITRTLAKELAPRKIRVNGILPGMIETEGVKSAGMNEGAFREAVEAQTPLGRIGQPADIAPAAVFLASPNSAYITGKHCASPADCANEQRTAAGYFPVAVPRADGSRPARSLAA